MERRLYGGCGSDSSFHRARLTTDGGQGCAKSHRQGAVAGGAARIAIADYLDSTNAGSAGPKPGRCELAPGAVLPRSNLRRAFGRVSPRPHKMNIGSAELTMEEPRLVTLHRRPG